MAEMVPGGFDSGPEFRTAESIAIAARVAAELGADWVKIPYAAGFEQVIADHGRVVGHGADAEAEGADALVVHGRTRAQRYKRSANWTIIAAVADALTIPVIGNGDIATAEDALRMLSQTGCDGIMIGRAAIGNPFIFSAVLAGLNGHIPAAPTRSQHFNVMRRYLKDSVAYLGERPACLMMRSRLGWFVKGLHGSSQFRKSITTVSSLEETMAAIDRYEERLANTPVPVEDALPTDGPRAF